MFDWHIFEVIREHWIRDQDHPYRGRSKRPIPEIADFVAVIETCFVASIKREEENITKFAVIWQQREDVDSNQSYLSQEILPFERKLPFNPESLAKLSASCDPNIGAIKVTRSMEPGSYEIWGLMFFGRTDTRFSKIPVGHPFSTGRPDLLTVTAVAPGSLIIYRGAARLGGLFLVTLFRLVRRLLWQGQWVISLFRPLRDAAAFRVMKIIIGIGIGTHCFT